MRDDVEAITEATNRWAAAFRARDVAASLEPVAEDVLIVPPNEPAVAGRHEFESWAKGMFAAIDVDEARVTIDEVRVAGDWAMSRGAWHMKGTAGGAPMDETTRYVLIWERGDGRWKIAYDLWNSASPAPGA